VPDLDAAAIHVEASDGVVQLSGFVEKESQRQLARTVAQRVPGVKQVKNRIEVK
jgi:hyperosmotically inducible periplasmic protein